MAATLGRQTSEAPQRASLCDEVPVLIWQADADGLVDHFNERVYEYSGATRDALVGSGWLHIIHPDDRQRCVHRWAYSLATRTPYEVELRLRSHDGTYRWFLAQAVPTIAHDGGLRWVGVSTEVHRYAAGISIADDSVSAPRGMFHDGTWPPWLHQRALERVARKATAREASSIISHLLNQPLTAILSNSQALQGMLNGDSQPAELNQTVADIVAEVRRAIRVLREWRVTSQGAGLQLMRVQLNDMVRDAAALLAGDLVADRCELELQLAQRSPEVRADAGQIQYALAMLVMNACEAMKDLPVESRRIRVRTLQDSAERACIEVADRGPGVRSGVLKAFEPPHPRRLQGLGLGLAICKGIIEAHDGRLQFVTGPALEGAVFRMELPAAAGPDEGS